ncbi:MAG: Crp/Fnr family transcriptional regulator [Arenicellales bacterium]
MNTALTSIPLFSNMSDEHLELLSSRLQHLRFTRNSVIITEGDYSDSLYIINTGKVKIYISDDNGREMLLRNLGPGAYFGELAFLDKKPRSASAITLCACQLSVISSKNLMQCLDNNPEMNASFLQVLVKRLREATESQRRLALMDVHDRLSMTLLSLSKEINGIRIIEPKPTQQELADMIGASREMVSRILKDLKTAGYIESCGTSLIIIKTLPATD